MNPVQGSFEEVDSYVNLSNKKDVAAILSNPYIDDDNKALIEYFSQSYTTTKYLYNGIEFVDV